MYDKIVKKNMNKVNRDIKFVLLFLIIIFTLAGCHDLFRQNQDSVTDGVSEINGLKLYYVGPAHRMQHLNDYVVKQKSIDELVHIESGYILLMDGYAHVDIETLKHITAHGNPLIVIENTACINSIDDNIEFSQITGKSPDGKISFDTVLVYMKQSTGSRSFRTIESNINTAIKTALKWVEEVLNEPVDANLVIKSSDPYWLKIHQKKITTDDDWEPYGKMNIRSIYYRLENDNDKNYDYYGVKIQHESVPGCSENLEWSAWQTNDMYTWLDADYKDSGNMLTEYAPTSSTVGSSTTSIGVTVGAEAGVSGGDPGAGVNIGGSAGWSYTVSDLQIANNSDLSKELAKWRHDINLGLTPILANPLVSRTTLQIKPGATIKTKQGSRARWKEHYGISYAQPILFGAAWENKSEAYLEFTDSIPTPTPVPTPTPQPDPCGSTYYSLKVYGAGMYQGSWGPTSTKSVRPCNVTKIWTQSCVGSGCYGACFQYWYVASGSAKIDNTKSAYTYVRSVTANTVIRAKYY